MESDVAALLRLDWAERSALAPQLRAVRNACALSPEQRGCIDAYALPERLAAHLSALGVGCGEDELVPARICLQVAANYAAGRDEGRRRLLSAFPAQLWLRLLGDADGKLSTYAKMALQNCLLCAEAELPDDFLRSLTSCLLSQRPEERLADEGTALVFHVLLGSRDILRFVGSLDDRQGLLIFDFALEAAKESRLSRANESSLSAWWAAAGPGAPWANPDALALPRAGLEVLAELAANPGSLVYQQRDSSSLFVAAGACLKELLALGAAGHAQLKPLRKLNEMSPEAQELISASPYFGLKVELLRLLSSLSDASSAAQSAARDHGILLAVLDCTSIEAQNPLQSQWALLCVRNLVQGSPENQVIEEIQSDTNPSAILASLQPEGGVFDSSGTSEALGVTVNIENGAIRMRKIIALFSGIYFLLEPMVLATLYVWCQLNKDMIVSFWFGTQFKAMYLPWVLVAFNMILRGGGMNELIGILVGHMYFFLMFKYPQDFGGAALLSTPQLLSKYFPNQRGGVQGFGSAPTAAPRRRDDGGQHAWGRGNALG